MKKKLFVLFLSAVMALSMSACGRSDYARFQSGNGNPPELTETDPDYIELAEYYVFEIDGDEYALPCKLSEFTDNGWYIDPEDLDYSIEPGYSNVADVYKDSSMDTEAFWLGVMNTSSETKKTKECYVNSIMLTGNWSCHSLTLKKAGVKLDISSEEAALQSVEDLKAAYGTDKDVLDESSTDDSYYGRWSLKCKFKYSHLIGTEQTTIWISKGGNSLDGMQISIDFSGLYK